MLPQSVAVHEATLVLATDFADNVSGWCGDEEGFARGVLIVRIVDDVDTHDWSAFCVAVCATNPVLS